MRRKHQLLSKRLVGARGAMAGCMTLAGVAPSVGLASADAIAAVRQGAPARQRRSLTHAVRSMPLSGIGNLGLGGRRSTVRAAVVGSVLLTLAGISVGLMQEAHAADSATPELPNLVADPPDDVSLGVDSSAGSERLLLRFNGYIQNVGPGALDFRGSRSAPTISKKVEEEVATAKENHTELPQKVEEELASPRMNVSQRLFTTDQPENEVERPHIEEPSTGEMVYVNADGHHHWHLQHVARYSLWNAAKTAEVAPAQKVGFCLDDSQHVEEGVGPIGPVYSSAGQSFCQRYNPDATSVYQGISRGWRDVYPAGIAFQWVDVSDVMPGEYWIREDVNPEGIVKETGGANAPAYSASPVTIPGFDAQPRSVTISTEGAHELALSATAWGDTNTPAYSVIEQPLHGKLGSVEGDRVTYTPTPGYSGPDSFTYAALTPRARSRLAPRRPRSRSKTSVRSPARALRSWTHRAACRRAPLSSCRRV